MAQSPLKDTTQPVDSEEEGQSSTMDRRWLIAKKIAMLRLVRLRSDAQNGRQTPQKSLTIKTLSDPPQTLPRTSEHLPPRHKMSLICLECQTHQIIKLFAQKLPSKVRAFPVSY